MKRNLLSGTALSFFLALTSAANAFDSGGEPVAPNAQISPMTSALVQGAQARMLFPGQAKASAQNVDPNSASGNPAQDRTLGLQGSANTPRKSFQGQLTTKASTLLANKQAADAQKKLQAQQAAANAGGQFDCGNGCDPNTIQSGGVPFIAHQTINETTFNVTKNVTAVTNDTTNVQNVTTNNNTLNQTGTITNVKEVTKVTGTNNTVTQTVKGVANGVTTNVVAPPN